MKPVVNKPYIVFFGSGKDIYCFEFKHRDHYLEALRDLNRYDGRLLSLMVNFKFSEARQLMEKARSVIKYTNGVTEILKTNRTTCDVSDLVCDLMNNLEHIKGRAEGFEGLIPEDVKEASELQEPLKRYKVEVGKLWSIKGCMAIKFNAFSKDVPVLGSTIESVLVSTIGNEGECRPPIWKEDAPQEFNIKRATTLDPFSIAFVVSDASLTRRGVPDTQVGEAGEVYIEIIPTGYYGERLKAFLDAGGTPTIKPRLITLTGNFADNYKNILQKIITWDWDIDEDIPQSEEE